MKSILLLALFFLFTSVLLPQSNIPQGTLNLAGSLSFSTTSSDGLDDNLNQLLLSPQVGYFFIDNVSLSLLIQYASNSRGDYSNTQWGLGPSLRYYLPLDKVYPFLELSYLYSKYIEIEDYVRNENIYIISGGLDYFLNENVAIESNLSYTFENFKLPEIYEDRDQIQNTFRIGIGLNIFIK